MKPISYQSMPSVVINGGHRSLVLDRLLTSSSSNVMHCEKCGFASTDPAVFRKHTMEHMGSMRFYCFYCNNVSFSEADLNTHLKQHTAKYPFECPHCGQGYMRRQCLVKHIERLHSKGIGQGPATPGTAKIPHVSVSGAFQSFPTVNLSSPQPAVRVTVPPPHPSTVRLGKDEQRGRTLDTHVLNATTGNTDISSPLNGLIHHNRALTVSLPEEVTIPAGCLVELVEVKTVNGTKELKLRLISKQENEPAIKDSRTTDSQNTWLGAPSLSRSNNPNMAKSTGLGTCTVNRKPYTTNSVNVERLAAEVIHISSNHQSQVSRDKGGLKRTSQEIIDLECHSVVPEKVPKIVPARESNGGIKMTQREPINYSAASTSLTSTRGPCRLPGTLHSENMGARVSSQKAVAVERSNMNPDCAKNVPPRRPADIKITPRDLSAVRLEHGGRLNNSTDNTPSIIRKEAVSSNQRHSKSASPPLAIVKVRPPTVPVRQNNIAKTSFLVPRTLIGSSSVTKPAQYNPTYPKGSSRTQELRTCERVEEEEDLSEPESFPIISSVFSLSQQLEEAQGSIQPLVLALRGIVMDKGGSSRCATRDHTKVSSSAEQTNKETAPESSAKVKSSPCDLSSTEPTSESVKVECHHKAIQHPPAPTQHDHFTEDKKSIVPTDNNKCVHASDSKSSTDGESFSAIAAHIDTSVSAEPLRQTGKSEQDVSSKYLTVSLKRVQVGVWKRSNNGLKLTISRYKTHVPAGRPAGRTAIYPLPLKVDQLVKRPGPNQPVVVLNHPKPQACNLSRHRRLRGTSQELQKCKILKMRLSKVMGQKYEVMGCTVGVFP